MSKPTTFWVWRETDGQYNLSTKKPHIPYGLYGRVGDTAWLASDVGDALFGNIGLREDEEAFEVTIGSVVRYLQEAEYARGVRETLDRLNMKSCPRCEGIFKPRNWDELYGACNDCAFEMSVV